MKVDGKSLAKEAIARKKENESLEKEGHKSEREQEAMGSHISEMASFIEAIHHKDPEKAHKHMMNYASFSVKPSEPQGRE